MAIKEIITRYELLVRFDDMTGEFKGAHAIDAVRYENTTAGTISHPVHTPARPITAAEFADMVGAEAARLIEAADAARLERDGALAQRDETAAALEARTNEMEAAAAQAAQTVEQHRTAAAEATARADAAEAQLAQFVAELAAAGVPTAIGQQASAPSDATVTGVATAAGAEEPAPPA